MTNSDFHRSAESADALYDSAYIAGLNRGYQLGLDNDHAALNKEVAARDGYLALVGHLPEDPLQWGQRWRFAKLKTAAKALIRAVEKTNDHVEWFPAIAKLRALLSSEEKTPNYLADNLEAAAGTRSDSDAHLMALAAEMLRTGDDAQPEKVSKDALAVATYIEELTTPRMIDLLLDRNDREIVIAALKTYAAQPPAAPVETEEDWREDPSSDERWNAGLDYGMVRFCACLGVDPKDVRWDAATEELDGDVCAVIGNILRVKFGENFDPDSVCRSSAVSGYDVKYHENVLDQLQSSHSAPTGDAVERLAEKLQQHWQGGGHAYTRPWDNGTDKDCVHGLPGQAEFFRQLARIAVEPQAAQVPVDQVARTIALSYGRDPDEMTEWTEMCDADNRPVPVWRVYEEQAEALFAAYSITREHS